MPLSLLFLVAATIRHLRRIINGGGRVSELSFADGKIQCRTEAGVGYLVINNPRRKNALTMTMWESISPAISFLENSGARVIIVCGEGADFSAGADISEFDTVRRDADSARLYESANSAAFQAVRSRTVPVIAAISGICFGGGFGLAAAADIRIANDDARFCVPPAKLGLAYPVDAMRDIVRALGDQWARTAIYTGDVYSAAEIWQSGFLLNITKSHDLMAEAEALACKIALNAPLSVRASRLAIRAVSEADPALVADATSAGAATFDSADYKEGRLAFTQRRNPDFTGR
jgi:enoyl-CoA hydratase/carnithine racemase